MKTSTSLCNVLHDNKTVTVHPSNIEGSIHAPASKSSMQRACAAALVRKGVSDIYNPGNSNDDKAALQLITDLGAIITNNDDGSITIDSTKFLAADIDKVNCGESGLGIRMFTPIISLHNHQITINGKGSLLTRPMGFFDEILPGLNIEISSNNGKLPLKIKGPLHPKNIEIDGSLSSQFLTGLLLAYAAVNAVDCAIKVINLKSKPYIDLTLKVMKDFHLALPENKNYEQFYFSDKNNSVPKKRIEYTVEGDWSGGAFLLVAGAIAGNITVNGLDINSTQADKKILEALKRCNSNLLINNNSITIGKSVLTAFNFDATDCPDLFPPLAVLAACCKGISRIQGVKRLTHKESNRSLTLQEELGKMGIEINLDGDVMYIIGTDKIKGAQVHSRHDHRIAMACSVAALKAGSATTIEEADAIKKSYPDFYNHLQLLGVIIN